MASSRVRSNRSLTNKITSLSKQAAAAQTAAAAASTQSVPGTNTVGTDAIQPQSVGATELMRGAVGTSQLGVINEIDSDSNLILSTPTGGGVQVQSTLYLPEETAPSSGNYDILTMDSTGAVHAATAVPTTAIPDSSNTVFGLIETAADTDAVTGTDTAKAITAHNLAQDRSRTGTVSSTWSFGQPTVTFGTALPDGTTSVTAYISPTATDVVPGSTVLLTHTQANHWVITAVTSQTSTSGKKFLTQIPLTINTAAGWYHYMDTASDVDAYGEALGPSQSTTGALTTPYATPLYYTMSSTGIVHVMGIAGNSSSPSAGSIIATLPAGFRPARAQPFTAQSGNAYVSLYVTTDGAIRYLAGTATSVTLDSVTFRASGYGTFTALTLLNGSAYTTGFGTGDSGGTGSHTPGYTVDSDGVVIFEGTVTGCTGNFATVSALSTQLTDLFLVPANASTGTNYIRFGGSSGSGTGNSLYMSTAGSTWTALSTIIVIPSSTTTTWINPNLYNSWATYSASYNTLGVAKTPEGYVFHRGMIASGTVAQADPAMTYPVGWRSRYMSNVPCTANGALGLWVIGSNWSTTTRAIYGSGGGPVVGSNSFFSAANVVYPAYA